MENVKIILEELSKYLRYHPRLGIFTWKITRRGKALEGDIAGTHNPNGYVYMTINGKDYKAHRLIWLFETGDWPVDQIDHINEVKCDNRFSNLREATNGQNKVNTSKRVDNKSGITGIHWEKTRKKWVVQTRVSKFLRRKKRFNTIEEAQKFRLEDEKVYYGDFSPRSVVRRMPLKHSWRTPTFTDESISTTLTIDLDSFI